MSDRDDANPPERSFSVDLRGIVDLLSRHLYSSPRVYVRELLQNAADALTARSNAAEPPGVGVPAGAGAGAAAARIWIETPEATSDGTLRVHDTGIGLTEAQTHDLLATIGRSSKRDDLGYARHEFLGQFGIGLLSCFLVADEVTVRTRSVVEPDAQTVDWTGHADGYYRVERAGLPRAEPGTTVVLRPRPGMAYWLSRETVTELVRHYGDLLPCPVSVDGEPVTEGELPWRAGYPDPAAREAALAGYGAQVLGFRPFAVVDLAVPEAGLTGVAFVLPSTQSPTARASHRVYLKRMLLGDQVEELLPEWAFFARCVVNTDELRPTADRERLYADDLLEAVRTALGRQLRDWLIGLASTRPDQLERFLAVHSLGVRALAVHDDEMLGLADRWLEFETADGEMTLAGHRERFDVVRYSPSVDEFRQLAPVARAQGIGLVNAGYAYDAEIVCRLPRLDPAIEVERIDVATLTTRFDAVDPEIALRLRGFVEVARRVLDRLDCEPVLRAYDPAGIPALYLRDRRAQQWAELRAARSEVEGAWGDVLAGAGFDDVAPARPQLVLNHRNPLVRRVSTVADPTLVGLAVEALYGQALLQSHHPMRPVDAAALNRSFLGLLDWAVHEPGTEA